MKRLVESWIEAERERYGNNLAAAIRNLNDQLGTALTHSRVSEWRRGVYVPSPAILSALLSRTLPWALGQAGIRMTSAQWRKLEALLWVTKERDGGRRSIELT